MKLLVQTTGKFMLIDSITGNPIEHNRPSVVEPSGFIQHRSMIQQVKHIADLSDEATDAEFHKYWKESEGDKDLAIASFVEKFGVKSQSEADEKSAPAKGKKAK